jgi:hypothetical protein
MFSYLAIVVLIALAIGVDGGSISGNAPPSSGDWVITNNTVVTDSIVTITGNITIEANLTLRGSSILIEGAPDGSLGINVTSGGGLVANDTSIVSSNGSPYHFRVFDEMDLTRVTIRNVHGGILISTSETVNIESVRILDFDGPGLVLEDASGTTVKDVGFQADGYNTGHNVSLSTNDTNPYVEWSHIQPGIIVVRGGSPSIEGVDISINGTFVLDLDYHKYNEGGGIGLDVDWALVYVNSKDSVAIKDLRLRDSDIFMTINAKVTDMFPSSFRLDTVSGVDVVLFRNYRDASISGIIISSSTYYYPQYTITGVQETIIEFEDVKWSFRAVHAFITESFTTAGPHEFDLKVADINGGNNPILYHHLDLSYTGTTFPTFDTEVLVDNVSTIISDHPLIFEIFPLFPLKKSITAKVTVSNSTFDQLMTSAITVDYNQGPNLYRKRGIVLEALTTIEDCVFTDCYSGANGVIIVPWGIGEHNRDDNTFVVRGCTFRRNTGTLLNIIGSTTLDRDRLIIDNNIFENNTAWEDQLTMNIQLRTEVELTNNTFSDNKCSSGIYIMDPGKNLVRNIPCIFIIANNTFLRNWDNPFQTSPGAIFKITWNGELIVRDNIINGTGPIFLNFAEIPDKERGAILDFHDNQVHRNRNPVLYFANNGKSHMYLVAYIRQNTVWDNERAFVDFPPMTVDLFHDYDATYYFLDNDVRRSQDTVFANYGNITVSGNTFVDCVGWVLELDFLRQERPTLTNNTFSRCGDAILIKAKPDVPAPVLMWMDNNVIDSNGTAIYLSQMEVTIRTTTITSSTGRAVVAFMSKVDAYDCDFEMEACEVVIDGYINMWYWVEAWVFWASKEGVATTNPVIGGNVTFRDQAGNDTVIAYPDDTGHLEPTEVLAWHITHSLSPVLKNPYTIMVSLSSFQTSVVQNVSISYKGDSALTLYLWDPEDPLVSIDYPEHMTAHNTLHLNITGFATDRGSGVHILTIQVIGGEPESVLPNPDGAYLHMFLNVPEGTHEIRANVSDAGNNTMSVSIIVEVDRTPPRLVVNYPAGDLFTNTTQVDLIGEVEANAHLVINMKQYNSSSGIFNITLFLNEGPNYFGLTATDRAGNTANVVINVTRDTFVPELEIYEPTDGQAINDTEIRVRGLAVDFDTLTITLHRRFTDIIDRPVLPDAEGAFDLMAELEEGFNEIVVTASDRAGNSITIRRTVVMDTTPPILELVSPENDVLINVRQVTIILSVSDDADQVYVNGKRVLGTGDLEAVVMLGEGSNSITIRAIDSLWNEVSTTIDVHVDTVAPVLEITEPIATRFKTNDPAIVVRGLVRDVDLEGITVSVDGNEATVTTDGRFHHLLILDEDGTQLVEVIARDRAGNIARAAFTVDLRSVGPQMILSFDPSDDRVDRGTILQIIGTSTGLPLSITIVHEADGDRTEYSFEMMNASFEYDLILNAGINTIEVIFTDTFGNTNTTAPHIVEVRDKDLDETIDDTVLWVIVALVAASFILGIGYLLSRRTSDLE